MPRAALVLSTLLLAGCATQPPALVEDPGPEGSTTHSSRAGAADLAGAPSGDGAARAPDTLGALLAFYEQWKGTRHRYGGNTRDGIDCSGLVLIGYRDLFGIDLPRTTRAQARIGQPIRRSELAIGDLIFFRTSRNWRHVGIYLGERRFLHVSSKRGVTISSLDNPYWKRRYWMSTHIARPVARNGRSA